MTEANVMLQGGPKVTCVQLFGNLHTFVCGTSGICATLDLCKLTVTVLNKTEGVLVIYYIFMRKRNK